MPEYADREITCTDCPVTFIFSEGEQKFFAERNLNDPPKRCHECRHKKKRQRTADKGGALSEEFPAVCSKCGDETMLPFRPATSRPVFCRNCFQRKNAAERSFVVSV